MPYRAALHHPQTSSLELEDGRRLEAYEPIGKGASSTVYRAVVESAFGLRRTVAVKVFGALASDDAEHVATAIALAAQQAAFVRHPNVVDTYDFVMWNQQPAILAELVEGVTLGTLLDRQGQRRLPLDLSVFIASEISEALSAARTASDDEGMQLKLVHAGLTPREVLLSWRGEVKVEGFGLDTARGGTSSVRSLRAVAGRANMMAPEVAAGERASPRSDVFSLGIMMRELLIGPRFPRGITNAEAIRLAREGYVAPICFQPQLPDALVEIMHRALQVDAEDRYPNATAMASDLRRIALGLGAGDCRYFMRRTLDREFNEGLDESTREVFPCAAQDDRD